jgi:hypothetical protein
MGELSREKLEPCPLCRSEKVGSLTTSLAAWMVDCSECGCSIARETEAEAIAAWNRRAEGPAGLRREGVREEIAQAEQALVADAEPPLRLHWGSRHISRCQADDDGDCAWAGCPQLRDAEPRATGRHCPFDQAEADGE